MLYKNAEKFEEKKVLIHLCPFCKANSYFITSAIAGKFSFFRHYATYRVKEIFHFFQKQFSKNNSRNFQFLRFSVKEISFPSFEGDLFITFDHVELMRFFIDCGKYVISIFSGLCVFPKLSFGRRVTPRFHS